MKIAQDVREYAAEHGIGNAEQAIEQGMEDKAKEFRRQGAEIYRKA
jgi:phosphomethylpyrimidine synthase